MPALPPPSDGYIGLAMASGFAAMGALVLAGLVRRANRK